MNGALLTLGGVSALAAASAWSKEPQRISPVVMLSAVSAGALLTDPSLSDEPLPSGP